MGYIMIIDELFYVIYALSGLSIVFFLTSLYYVTKYLNLRDRHRRELDMLREDLKAMHDKYSKAKAASKDEALTTFIHELTEQGSAMVEVRHIDSRDVFFHRR